MEVADDNTLIDDIFNIVYCKYLYNQCCFMNFTITSRGVST